MKKSIKLIIIISAVAIAVGMTLSLVGFAASGFDVRSLSTVNLESFDYSFDSSEINSITVDSAVADVRIVESESTDKVEVKILQDGAMVHSAIVRDGVLNVTAGELPWYMSLGFAFGDMSVTVYLPSKLITSLNIETDTGDISVAKGQTFSSAEISSDTGDISFYSAVTANLSLESDTGDIFINATAPRISAESDTGEITLRSTVATEKIKCTTDTGDIELDGCDAPELYFESSTGDVEGTLYSAKQFITSSKTGDIHVPRSDSDGGICEIKTATGDIEIRISLN